MLIGIADHPTFTNLPFTNFELGLDQGNNVTARLDQRSCRRQDLLERNERGIDHGEVRNLVQLVRCQMPDIGAFEINDPLIIAQLPGKLTVTDVNGKDLPGTPLQQAIGKTTGRGSHIKCRSTCCSHLESLESPGKLEPAA